MVTNTSGCIAVCDETVARMVVWLLPAISGATNLLSLESLYAPTCPTITNPLRMAECATVIGKPSHRAGRGGRACGRETLPKGKTRAAAHLEVEFGRTHAHCHAFLIMLRCHVCEHPMQPDELLAMRASLPAAVYTLVQCVIRRLPNRLPHCCSERQPDLAAPAVSQSAAAA